MTVAALRLHEVEACASVYPMNNDFLDWCKKNGRAPKGKASMEIYRNLA